MHIIQIRINKCWPGHTHILFSQNLNALYELNLHVLHDMVTTFLTWFHRWLKTERG